MLWVFLGQKGHLCTNLWLWLNGDRERPSLITVYKPVSDLDNTLKKGRVKCHKSYTDPLHMRISWCNHVWFVYLRALGITRLFLFQINFNWKELAFKERGNRSGRRETLIKHDKLTWSRVKVPTYSCASLMITAVDHLCSFIIYAQEKLRWNSGKCSSRQVSWRSYITPS